MDQDVLKSLGINKVAKELRKDSLSIKNRLQSIIYDANYVQSLFESHGRTPPIIPNERCGLWYVPSGECADTSYFKSTDGHTNNWGFSLRRLNLHLLDYLRDFGTMAIVDSTRRGKLMPDALSKTIPIWCAVLTYIMYEDDVKHMNSRGNEMEEMIPDDSNSQNQIEESRLDNLLLHDQIEETKSPRDDSLNSRNQMEESRRNDFLNSHNQMEEVKSPRENLNSHDQIAESSSDNSLSPESMEEDAELSDLRQNNWLKTPRAMVSRNEHNEIVKRIPQFARELKSLHVVTRDDLIKRLGSRKPIIAEWHYPDEMSSDNDDDPFYFGNEACDDTSNASGYFTVKCVTASMKKNGKISVRHAGGASTTWTYVQGAADDHELWATKEVCNGNFDASTLWDVIFAGPQPNGIIDSDTQFIYDWISDEELVRRINEAYELHTSAKSTEATGKGLQLDFSPIKNDLHDTGILLGRIEHSFDFDSFMKAYPGTRQLVIFSNKFSMDQFPKEKPSKEQSSREQQAPKEQPQKEQPSIEEQCPEKEQLPEPQASETQASKEQKDKPQLEYWHYQIESTKKGSKQLRSILPKIVPRLALHAKYNSRPTSGAPVMILCDTGKDIGVGLVLAVLCQRFDMSWAPKSENAPSATSGTINKDTVKQHLAKVLAVRKVNPSRNTLQSVNTYLM